jgi:hypothetical protein
MRPRPGLIYLGKHHQFELWLDPELIPEPHRSAALAKTKASGEAAGEYPQTQEVQDENSNKSA